MDTRWVLLGALALAFAVGCTSAKEEGRPVDASADSTAMVIPPPTDSDPLVRKGWSSVVNRGCATCHQSPAVSDGVLSGQTEHVPNYDTAYGSNLTPDPDTGMDAWDAASIVGALRKGIDENGLPLCPAMPRYTEMSDDEGNAIAAYLQNLPAVHHYIPASVCPPIEPRPDAGSDADAAPDGPTDADAEAGPCTPTIGEFSKCSYIVNLPCGGTYEESDCYLLLSDCATLCTSGAASCHYATGCDGGTVTRSPAEPAQVECFIPTSVICGPGVDL